MTFEERAKEIMFVYIKGWGYAEDHTSANYEKLLELFKEADEIIKTKKVKVTEEVL